MITNLFTYAVSRHKLDLSDDYARKITQYGNAHVKENGRTEGDLHTVELFSPLASMFSSAVRSHITELGFGPDNEFVITQMWFNRYVQDDFLRVHTHPNSIYSGVFYYR